MIGAIIGDIVGSRFEFDNINKKEFEFWGEGCEFTDDTVMTIAVAEALLYTRNPNELGNVLRDIMRDYGHGYPNVGYGGMFRQWLMSTNPQPYNSFGNGSAMRVSPCGYIAESLEEALALAKASAEISHNHPEGIKGAEAVAGIIFLSKINACGKNGIKAFIEKNYYKLDFTLDEVKQKYHFSESCQDTVPQAIMCFLEAENFEDTIRNAVSVGGDSDTIACIAGSIAEAYYGVPDEMIKKAKTYLPKCFADVISQYYTQVIEISKQKTGVVAENFLCDIDYSVHKKQVKQIADKIEGYISSRNINNSEDYYDFRKLSISEWTLDDLRYISYSDCICLRYESGWLVYNYLRNRFIANILSMAEDKENIVLKELRNMLRVKKEMIDETRDSSVEEQRKYFYKNWRLKDLPNLCVGCDDAMRFCHSTWCAIGWHILGGHD